MSKNRPCVPDRAETEVPIGNFVADVRAGDDVLYEIQTGSFGPLKRKLATLLEAHRVVLVFPIAQVRYILKVPEDRDEAPKRRRSPKRGSIAHVVEALVSIPMLLDHPNFELEVVLIAEEEVRVFDPGKVRQTQWLAGGQPPTAGSARPAAFPLRAGSLQSGAG